MKRIKTFINVLVTGVLTLGILTAAAYACFVLVDAAVEAGAWKGGLAAAFLIGLAYMLGSTSTVTIGGGGVDNRSGDKKDAD